MAKRNALAFDRDALTENLKASAGQGVGALFSTLAGQAAHGQTASPPPPGEPMSETISKQVTTGAPARHLSRPAKARKPLKPPEQQAVRTDPEGTALPLSEDDIEMLREPAYKAQTFRLTQAEIDWIRDTAYRLSKEMRRGKVAQADVLRIALKLFEEMLASKKDQLLTILDRIK